MAPGNNQAPALVEVIGPWHEELVKAKILQYLSDGFRIVHMSNETRKTSYVSPDDPAYAILQHRTNSAEPMMVTYMAREKKS